MNYILDEKGWRLGADEQYHSPWVEDPITGEWVERDDIEWLYTTNDVEFLLEGALEVEQFDYDGVRITMVEPPDLIGSALRMRVMATDVETNALLAVDDGVILFHDFATTDDQAADQARLQRDLVQVIKGLNQ